MTPKLTRIWRYPLKGFSGEVLEYTTLGAAHGIAHDRRFAIENGSLAALTSRDWAECKHFMRLTVERGLVRYGVTYDHASRWLSVTSPDGTAASVNVDCPEDRARFDAFLQQRFVSGPHGPIRLVEYGGNAAYWDFADAPISIINTRSVEAISAHTQQALTCERFRANLEFSGLNPWEEFSWIGRTIQIGSVTLYITAPIERCSATSVDPLTGEVGCSVPHVLQTHFGHQYCGVYARVVSAGEIRAGDTLWCPSEFRRLWVKSVVQESADVISLTLGGQDGELLPPFVAGQYLAVRQGAERLPELQRNYTISNESAWPQTAYRISVKRKGAVSQWLHGLQEGAAIEVGAPKGNFVWLPSPRTTVLVAGGIGITPLLAMLKQLATRDPDRKVWLFYGVRNWGAFSFREELEQLCAQLPNLRLHVFFSRGRPAEQRPSFASHTGRISIDRLRALLPFDAYEFYLCGPSGMLRNIAEGLLRLSVPNGHIRIERFGTVADVPTQADFPAQALVRFAKTQRHGVWREHAQTLLEFVEHHGIHAPNDCRAGTCGACRCTVRGRVHYMTEPVFSLKDNEALLCCARPLEDLEVDL